MTRIFATTAATMIQSGNSKHDDVSSTSDTFLSLPVEDCVYRGEGNANLVISLPQELMVIRFRKSLPAEASPDDDKIRVKREVEFVRHVVSGYLGSYVRIPEIVRYDPKDVALLLEIIRPFRPVERKQKSSVKNYSTKMPDYAFLPLNFASLNTDSFRSKSTFAIEIKPKQGYQSQQEKPLQKCPYCLTQYYKLKKRVIQARSTYCPFDLFSGDEVRIKKAIESLSKSPQNNFKIFKDGTVVYDQGFPPNEFVNVLDDWRRCIDQASNNVKNENSVDLFCNLTRAALLHSFPETTIKTRTEEEVVTRTRTWSKRKKRTERSKASTVTSESNRAYLTFDERDRDVSADINKELIAKARKLLSRVQEKECKRDHENLPKDCVLDRILTMQRLPYVGTKHVYDIYEKYATSINDDFIYSKLINEDLNEEKETLINLSLSSSKKREQEDRNGNRYENVDSTWPTTENVGKFKSSRDLNEWEINSTGDNDYVDNDADNVNIKHDCDKTYVDAINNDDITSLQNYLMFSTARDCSILIAFRPLNPKAVSKVPREYVIKMSEDLYFLTSIRVSDLDPKSIHSIAKHKRRDTDVLNSVISLLEEEEKNYL